MLLRRGTSVLRSTIFPSFPTTGHAFTIYFLLLSSPDVCWDPSFAGGLKVLGCCGLIRFQFHRLVGHMASTSKGLSFCFVFASCFGSSVFRHRWTVCFCRISDFLVLYFQFGLVRPLLVLAFVHVEGWLVGRAAVSGGWFWFRWLVVCIGCSTLASGMFFLFVRVVRDQRLSGRRLLAYFDVVWFYKPERVWFC